MFYILYKTTNKVTGEYYIGVHGTHDLNDDYLGSGTKLLESVDQYGSGAFTRKIIHVFDSKLRAQHAEYCAVTQKELDDPLCLNIALGGGSDFERMLIEDLIINQL